MTNTDKLNATKAEEIAYWQSRPVHERFAEMTRLSAEAYGLKNIEELKMDKTLVRMRFTEEG